MNERRNARRRRLPFVRGAVLDVGGRNHIVSVSDLAPDGAFLAARVAVAVGDKAVLRLVLPRGGREASLPCEVVWRSESVGAAGTAAGIAVRFHDLEPAVARRVAQFAEEGPRPRPEASSPDRFQYRLLDAPEVDERELNRLGLDGWRLACAVPSGRGFQLILLRRL